MKKNVFLLSVSAMCLIVSLLRPAFLPFDAAWGAIALCGIPILLEAGEGLFKRFDIKADLLVAMALIASVAIGEIFAAGEVAFIMQLGELLEDLTVDRARAGIERMVSLKPRTARIVRGGAETVVPAEDVRPGDTVRVLAGETVPVDGTIVSGITSIDQSVVTGESLPVDKGAGDAVYSGTVNRFGVFEMRADRACADSTIARMVRLVESADASKAKIVSLADRWATWIVVAALAASVLAFALTRDLIRSVTVLVVFCPCSLVLATPTAVMAAIGNAAGHNVLVKEGDALERLATVGQIAFDKTGTLTRGTPTVVDTIVFDDSMDRDALLRIAACAEKRSEHPLGRAIAAARECNGDVRDFAMLPGRGISCTVDGSRVLAGNPRLLAENGVFLPEQTIPDGATAVFVALDGVAKGMILLRDTLREDAAQGVADILREGVSCVLLTGDSEKTASRIAKEAGIGQVRANCTPEEKLRFISASPTPVCMIGDGVNDAPALRSAHVGIAMGGAGSDIAVEAADIALVKDGIGEVAHLLRLSRRMMRVIRRNIVFSMALNFLSIALAMAGILNPVVGALVHNCGSVFVIVHSALLLKFGAKRGR